MVGKNLRWLPVALGLGLVAFVGWSAAPGGPHEPVHHPQPQPGQPQHPGATPGPVTQPAHAGGMAQMEMMQKHMSALAEAINAATKAVEAGDKEAALAALVKAKAQVETCQRLCAQRHAMMGPVVNKRCPIMGTVLDPAKVPEDLTRLFKGHKVGFCCAACPVAWDKLTDEEKHEKLKAAMAP